MQGWPPSRQSFLDILHIFLQFLFNQSLEVPR
jgi:hypothetical protein